MPASIQVKHLGKALLAIGIALFFLVLYLDIAQKQSRRNHDLTRSDQRAYMNFAKKAYESRLQYTGNRNRMPLYPWIQALFYSPQMDDETFFQQGKRLNVALSLVCLLALGIAFFAKFSKLYAFYAILAIAFLVFAIKSPYFQVEILFYTLFGLAFMLSLDTLISPKWRKSIGVGVLFALAHFSKASALPGLFIFISSYGVLFLSRLFSRSLNRGQARQILYYALTPLVVFMVLLFPYFQESKEKYGTYFYNVNTTFYMWYDSWNEVENGTRLAGDRRGWPDMPDEEIPSLSKYLREHTTDDIIERFRNGAAALLRSGCHNSNYSFGYCSQVGLSLLILALGLPLLFKGIRRRKGNKNMHIVWYVLLFFLLYALSFVWYAPIIGSGHRAILSLGIPLLWTIGLVAHAPQIQSLWVKNFLHGLYLLLTLTLLYEIYQIIALRAETAYSGSPLIPLLWIIVFIMHALKGIEPLRRPIFSHPIKGFHIVYLLMTLTLFYEIYQVAAFRAATMNGGN